MMYIVVIALLIGAYVGMTIDEVETARTKFNR